MGNLKIIHSFEDNIIKFLFMIALYKLPGIGQPM